MKNKEIAALFDEIADALEVKGEMKFKVLVYRRAARALHNLTQDVADLAKNNTLLDVDGIGEATAKKIVEYLKTGTIKRHQEALAGLSPELLELLKIVGLGPRTLFRLHKELKVSSLADLKRVLESGALARLTGMGEKKAEQLRRGIEFRERSGKRMLLDTATEIAGSIIAHLSQLPEIKAITPAGSLRRNKETVGDIDILVTGADATRIVKHFTQYPGTVRVLGAGDTKASILVHPHAVQVDLRILPEETYGAALQYFTGSKEHNVKLRTIAKAQGLKVSEYGVFRDDKRIAGRTEEEVYAALGMPLIPPELREDRGEIEAALSESLPHLIELTDIRGDLHLHTVLSDGVATIDQLVSAAQARGYEYIAITDHSRAAGYAGGLDPDRLAESVAQIEALNRTLQKKPRSAQLRVLASAEVDILPNGKLDYPDRVLEKLDVVVASVHQAFDKNVTERMCDALANHHVDILGHPSGRLLSRRQGYVVDLDKVLECARRHNKILELNSYPDRLDLTDIYLRKAKEMGIMVVISTDAHSVSDLDWMRFGVATARRGWLERKDVLNCLSLKELLARVRSKGR